VASLKPRDRTAYIGVAICWIGLRSLLAQIVVGH